MVNYKQKQCIWFKSRGFTVKCVIHSNRLNKLRWKRVSFVIFSYVIRVNYFVLPSVYNNCKTFLSTLSFKTKLCFEECYIFICITMLMTKKNSNLLLDVTLSWIRILKVSCCVNSSIKNKIIEITCFRN